MDLQTVKSRIKCGEYSSIDSFLQDMFLIFSNCLKYNRKNSKLGKVATCLKRYFEKRCSDLGLKDLNLSGMEHMDVEGSGGTHGGRRQSSRLRH